MGRSRRVPYRQLLAGRLTISGVRLACTARAFGRREAESVQRDCRSKCASIWHRSSAQEVPTRRVHSYWHIGTGIQSEQHSGFMSNLPSYPATSRWKAMINYKW